MLLTSSTLYEPWALASFNNASLHYFLRDSGVLIGPHNCPGKPVIAMAIAWLVQKMHAFTNTREFFNQIIFCSAYVIFNAVSQATRIPMGLVIGPVILIIAGLYLALAIFLVIVVNHALAKVSMILVLAALPFTVAYSYLLSPDYKEFAKLCTDEKRTVIGLAEPVEYLPIPIGSGCAWGLKHVERYSGLECYKKIDNETFEVLKYKKADDWDYHKCKTQCISTNHQAELLCPEGCLISQQSDVTNNALEIKSTSKRNRKGKLFTLSTEYLRGGETIASNTTYRYEITNDLWSGVFHSLMGVSVKQHCANNKYLELTEKFVPIE